jgi:cation diffusion facilitator family transporter
MTAAGAPSTPAIKQRMASLSIISNSTLIVVKVIAGTLTGSVAILTDAIHSSIDLIASVVAFFSIRKADEPADESHRYGHEKIENVSAALEGILILVGSAVIVFEAIRRLISGGHVHNAGIGLVVLAGSLILNVCVSTLVGRTAAETESAALESDAAHLRTDAITSGGVLVGIALVDITGAQWIDPAVALLVAWSIVFTGVKLVRRSTGVLVDAALPDDEVTLIREAIERFGPRGVVGYHELRTRRAGARRYIDLHVQFRSGTSLEDAHRTGHELQDEIAARLGRADVLIHLEPEDRVRPGEELPAADGLHVTSD